MPALPVFSRLARLKKPAIKLDFQESKGQTWIHPCVIKGQPHYVYPRGLRESSPQIYNELVLYANKRGYHLKEDQRRHDTGSPTHSERRKWVPVMLFTVSMLFESSAYADLSHHHDSHNQQDNHQIVLRIMHEQRVRTPNEISDELAGHKQVTELKSATASQIFEILAAHYRREASDPAYIRDDLKQIANYYSEFPDVIDLLMPLRDKHWELAYDEHHWDTIGIGNQMEVNKAVIHFNTRSAAQLLLNRKCKENPVCIASPADALLHELLHTHSMLIETQKFIEQGGMDTVMYPYAHEYAILDAERKLYASMSRIDAHRRPQRTDHTGRAVYAHCPICIK